MMKVQSLAVNSLTNLGYQVFSPNSLLLGFSILSYVCPPWLGCRVRVSGLVFLLSPVLSPNLSPILAGVLSPPPWTHLSLVSGLVSQLVSGLGCCVCLPSLVLLLSPSLSPILAGVLWDAVSASLVSSCSCLPTCRPSGLGCCVRLPGLVFLLSLVLSPNLSPVWDGCCVHLPSLFLLLSPVLFPSVSFCPSPWSRLSLVFGRVSQLVSGLGCCVRLPGFVLLLSPVLSPSLSFSCFAACLRSGDAVSASLVLSCSCLPTCLPS